MTLAHDTRTSTIHLGAARRPRRARGPTHRRTTAVAIALAASGLGAPAAARAAPPAPARDCAALPEPLGRQALAAAILRCNAERQAALAEVAQARAQADTVRAHPDPMVQLGLAPLSLGPRPRGDDHGSAMGVGWSAGVEQRLVVGKLRLAHQAALAQAEAQARAAGELDQALLALGQALYDDWALLEQARAQTREQRAVLATWTDLVAAGIAANQTARSDALELELAAARLGLRERLLDGELAAVQAQVNVLVHRAPGAPLPALDPDDAPWAPAARQARSLGPDAGDDPAHARATHPRLRALEAEAQAAELRARLARRSFVPELAVMTSVSTMWPDPRHRWMIGVGVELPLAARWRRAERAGARAEQARIARARLAADDAIQREHAVAQAEAAAAERRREALEAMIPTAEAWVEALALDYASGRAPIDRALAAQRELLDLRLELLEAHVQARRARIAAAEAIGGLGVDAGRGGDR